MSDIVLQRFLSTVSTILDLLMQVGGNSVKISVLCFYHNIKANIYIYLILGFNFKASQNKIGKPNLNLHYIFHFTIGWRRYW